MSDEKRDEKSAWSPGLREAFGAAMKAAWADPEFRAHMKRTHTDPEYRAKLGARIKAARRGFVVPPELEYRYLCLVRVDRYKPVEAARILGIAVDGDKPETKATEGKE